MLFCPEFVILVMAFAPSLDLAAFPALGRPMQTSICMDASLVSEGSTRC